MEKIHSNTGNQTRHQKSKSVVTSANLVDLNTIIQNQGYQEGRLFHSDDKATYTFVHDDEVISMHFDLSRQYLFIKGHRITRLQDHPYLTEFLARFKKALMEQRSAKKFLDPFTAAVSRLGD